MQFAKHAIAALAASVLLGCASPTPQPQPAFELTLLHINDHHSNLAAKQRTLTWSGQHWQVESGGFARVVAQLNDLRQQHNNVLTLHAGDAITGSLFDTLFGSEVDAAAMNQACFDAFTIGNHEFDDGDEGLAEFLQALGTANCPTAKLSANVHPEVGVSPLTRNTSTDLFSPYTVLERGGESVAVVGLTIAEKTKKSSQPDASTQFADELSTARKTIDSLREQGIEKIILLTHLQYQRDIELIAQLPAVDVVIGGDSHTLLGDTGLTDSGDMQLSPEVVSAGPYPTVLTNADGDTVCLAHAYRYSQVVGELTVNFNGDKVASCGGRPHFLLGEQITPVEGAVTTVEPVKQALRNTEFFSLVRPDADTQQLLSGYQQQVEDFATEVVATVPQTICKQDIHQSRRPGCADVISSGAHRLTAEAFLHAVPEADFALQNGSSIRGDITAGDFTVGAAFELLPYANTLLRMRMSGSELKQVLEEAMAYVVAEQGSVGAYPYGAGVRYEVDLNQGFGDRVTHIAVFDKGQQRWQPVRPRANYTLVTNSYIGGGQAGYDTLHSIAQQGRSDNTGIDYAQAMADYARSLGVLERPEEFATQSYRPLTSE